MRLAFVIFIVRSWVVAYFLEAWVNRGLVNRLGAAAARSVPLRRAPLARIGRIGVPPWDALDQGFRWQHVKATGTLALLDGGVVAVAVLPREVISPARIVDLATPRARAERA
jgi:hypothetical protein